MLPTTDSTEHHHLECLILRSTSKLRRVREARGYSQVALAQRTGVSQPDISALEREALSPTGTNGTWRCQVYDLADVLGVLPGELFPRADAPCTVPLDHAASVAHPADLEALIEVHEDIQLLIVAMEQLPAQGRRALALRYGIGGHEEHSLAAVGRKLTPPVGAERARQIVRTAYFQLRECGPIPAAYPSLMYTPRSF